MIELEDLLTKCTDKNSKIYIEEAIKSYKNGAYRACINSTWLAVFTNIIYKIEQLALLNDSNAIQRKNNIDLEEEYAERLNDYPDDEHV